ncbi:Hypothetical protein GLP15_6 [Giardia lamblia P15]|uniref:Uncharacterized protein n=1 Tax=Giardia intestinalis (strain P15) TaxID=658858 RepID=E1EWF9_GIAIA|nr:Hypothetical protein GLP15_6 [Giardia lamblia P15]
MLAFDEVSYLERTEDIRANSFSYHNRMSRHSRDSESPLPIIQEPPPPKCSTSVLRRITPPITGNSSGYGHQAGDLRGASFLSVGSRNFLTEGKLPQDITDLYNCYRPIIMQTYMTGRAYVPYERVHSPLVSLQDRTGAQMFPERHFSGAGNAATHWYSKECAKTAKHVLRLMNFARIEEPENLICPQKLGGLQCALKADKSKLEHRHKYVRPCTSAKTPAD